MPARRRVVVVDDLVESFPSSESSIVITSVAPERRVGRGGGAGGGFAGTEARSLPFAEAGGAGAGGGGGGGGFA